ncbi:MAG: ABC transporter ATP-binding protein [Oscillospiraceae bacterium]|nr:ABC transporter ATP-binding protein [Oscillospiraceae bacterium]
MSKITLKNIYKTYAATENHAELHAVTDFNLEIQSGEIVALVGPSGCGKTTTLRMIAGLEEITSGELRIDSKPANDIPPKDRNLSMVFQNYALFPSMSVYENIAFGLYPADPNSDQVKAKVAEVAKTLEITHLLERMPYQTSGGQKQRIALARAFVQDKNIVLLDEAFSNLDARLRDVMRFELTKYHKIFGKTLILVTHDINEAMPVASKIVVMRDGIIQQVGTPEEVYLKPANKFVANFVAPWTNFFEVEIIESEGKLFARADGGFELFFPPSLEKNHQIHNYVGKKVTMALRPETLGIWGEGDHVQDYNSRSESWSSAIYAKLQGNFFTCSTRTVVANPVGTGLQLKLHVHNGEDYKDGSYITLTTSGLMRDMLFFDADTEQAI